MRPSQSKAKAARGVVIPPPPGLTERERLEKMSDREFIQACEVRRGVWNEKCDDELLKLRLRKYPKLFQYKRKDETWRDFFLNAIYRIAALKERYNFDYTGGDLAVQYDALERFGNLKGPGLLILAADEGDLHLIDYALKRGDDINQLAASPLRRAVENRDIHTVKYLIERGADAHFHDGEFFKHAANNGYTEIVEYLLDHGVDVNVWGKGALAAAAEDGNLDMLKILVKHGADMRDKEGYIELASKNNHYDIVEYIRKLPNSNRK